MPSRRVVIYVAIQIESEALGKAMGLTFSRDRLSASITNPNGLAIDLHVAGIGARRLVDQRIQADLIISAGLAGALDPGLRCGDVVVDGALDATIFPAMTGVHFGSIHTSDLLVATPAKKAATFEQTRALAVDMETEHLRSIAARNGVPFVAMRAISDRADESIEPALLQLVDANGKPRVAAAMGLLARRPRLIAETFRLKRNSDRALKALGNYLTAFLALF